MIILVWILALVGLAFVLNYMSNQKKNQTRVYRIVSEGKDEQQTFFLQTPSDSNSEDWMNVYSSHKYEEVLDRKEHLINKEKGK